MPYKPLDEYLAMELFPNHMKRKWDFNLNTVDINSVNAFSQEKYYWINYFVDEEGKQEKISIQSALYCEPFSNKSNSRSGIETEYFLAFDYIYGNVVSQQEFIYGLKNIKQTFLFQELIL